MQYKPTWIQIPIKLFPYLLYILFNRRIDFFFFKTFFPARFYLYLLLARIFIFIYFFIFSVFLHRTLIKRREEKKKKEIFPRKIFCCLDILNMKEKEAAKTSSLPDLKMPNYEQQFNAFSICFQINGYQIYYKRNSLLKKILIYTHKNSCSNSTAI